MSISIYHLYLSSLSIISISIYHLSIIYLSIHISIRGRDGDRDRDRAAWFTRRQWVLVELLWPYAKPSIRRCGIWQQTEAGVTQREAVCLDQRKHQSSASLDFCEGNSSVTSEFPAQSASKAKNASIWWRHPVIPRSSSKIRVSTFYHQVNWYFWLSPMSMSSSSHTWIIINYCLDTLSFGHVSCQIKAYDDVMSWKRFPRHCSFVRGIHWSPVKSPHTWTVTRALTFPLMST